MRLDIKDGFVSTKLLYTYVVYKTDIIKTGDIRIRVITKYTKHPNNQNKIPIEH